MKFFIINIFLGWLLIQKTYSIEIIHDGKRVDHPQNKKQQDKRSVIFGDVSYSYAATDIGSPQGTHVKTITVIKNVAIPQSKVDQFNEDEFKKEYNVLLNVPGFPEISSINIFSDDINVPDKRKVNIQSNKNLHKPQSTLELAGSSTTRLSPQTKINIINDKKRNDAITSNQKHFQNEQIDDIHQPTGHALTEDSLPVARGLSNNNYFKKIDNERIMSKSKPIPKDVELIHLDSDIKLEDAVKSKVAQERRLFENSLNNNRTAPSSVENKTKLDSNVKHMLDGKKLTSLSEHFSEESLHTVKHLNDPLKPISSYQVEYHQSNSPTETSIPKATTTDKPVNIEQFDDYGSKIEKSEYYHEHNYPTTRKIPYVSPSIQKAYLTSSTTSQMPYLAPLKSRGPQTFPTVQSTTQIPYIAPLTLKDFAQARIEMEKMRSEELRNKRNEEDRMHEEELQRQQEIEMEQQKKEQIQLHEVQKYEMEKQNEQREQDEMLQHQLYSNAKQQQLDSSSESNVTPSESVKSNLEFRGSNIDKHLTTPTTTIEPSTPEHFIEKQMPAQINSQINQAYDVRPHNYRIIKSATGKKSRSHLKYHHPYMFESNNSNNEKSNL